MIDLGVGFTLISPRFKLLWFFNVFYHFEYVPFSLPCAFVSFIPFVSDLIEDPTWQGSIEMTEGEVILDKVNLGRLTKDSLRT